MNILVYDVHASESGALSILDDLYKQVCNCQDKSIKWIFVVSTPHYKSNDNITVLRFPWVKKSWLHRIYFETVVTRRILKEYQPNKIFSLQNKGISYSTQPQCVYLHLPFVLSDYKMSIFRDGKRLWIYQNVLSKFIFSSLKKVNRTIVQTQWMKDALIRKAGVHEDSVVLAPPDISENYINIFKDSPESRKNFFYPATAFTYKNHITILKACHYLQQKNIMDYRVTFTIRSDENKYTEMLYRYVQKHKLQVSFEGKIPRDEVFRKYTNSTLLFPSFIESFGLPLLEGRLSGSFIAASDSPFAREILDGYENAMFFDHLDYKTLGDYMIEIMSVRQHVESDRTYKPYYIKPNVQLTNIVLNM